MYFYVLMTTNKLWHIVDGEWSAVEVARDHPDDCIVFYADLVVPD